MMLPKWIATKPVVRTMQYLKFGFVRGDEWKENKQLGYAERSKDNESV